MGELPHMNKRPLSVTIIGWVYIVMGAIGFASGVSDFRAQHPFQFDIIGVELIRLTAAVSGAFMLRGDNWARWLALAWMGFHVILSAFHTVTELAIHSLFFAVLAYFLSRPTVTNYFRAART
jgi:hypothetical protein